MDSTAPAAPEGAPRHAEGAEPALAEREMFAEMLADVLGATDADDPLAEALRARAGLLLGALDTALAAARRGRPREAALEAFVGALARPADDPAPAKPAGEEELDLAALRLALQTRIREIGLRATSREVGISPTAAHDLAFKGVQPYQRTRRLLTAWYGAWAVGALPMGRVARRRTLHDLTRHLPPEARAGLVERIESLLDHADARERGASAPRTA